MTAAPPPPGGPSRWAVAAVSYLNSAPLVDGLEGEPDVALAFDVPSRLLGALEGRRADVALCPVIDLQRSREPLALLPVGGIGSEGDTLTVRLFSRIPFPSVRTVAVDGDSHTSAALTAVILAELAGRVPELVPLPPEAAAGRAPRPETLLLIGDKVVTARPSSVDYPHQLDLGGAWRALTGLPFLFAAWTVRVDAALGDLPDRLRARRDANLARLAELAARRAPPAGWPEPLARAYLERHLAFRVGLRQLEAVEEFWRRCRALGLLGELRPLVLAARPDGEETNHQDTKTPSDPM